MAEWPQKHMHLQFLLCPPVRSIAKINFLACFILFVAMSALIVFFFKQVPNCISHQGFDSLSASSPKTREGGFSTVTENFPQWAVGDVPTFLTERNVELIAASSSHAKALFERAKEALENDGDVIYGKIDSPLLMYLNPKAGSNTLNEYATIAMAAIGKVLNRGCVPDPDRYTCMYERNDTGCSVAFSNHFRPEKLSDVILHAEQKKSSRCKRWRETPLNTSSSDYDIFREIHERSVCVLPFREPVDQALSSFYEWAYLRRTNLTAFEYLEKHGSLKFLKMTGRGSAYEFVQKEHFWPVILENCLVGVTDNFDEFSETLSRVLKFPKLVGGSAIQIRHREKIGETPEKLEQFRNQLTPLFKKSAVLYQLIKKIAAAQHRISKTFSPLYPVYNKTTSISCKMCQTKKSTWKAGGWAGIRLPLCENWQKPHFLEEVSVIEQEKSYFCTTDTFVP